MRVERVVRSLRSRAFQRHAAGPSSCDCPRWAASNKHGVLRGCFLSVRGMPGRKGVIAPRVCDDATRHGTVHGHHVTHKLLGCRDARGQVPARSTSANRRIDTDVAIDKKSHRGEPECSSPMDADRDRALITDGASAAGRPGGCSGRFGHLVSGKPDRDRAERSNFLTSP